MRIPEVREALLEIATDPRIPHDLTTQLINLESELYRRRTPRTKAKSKTMTVAMIAAVRMYKDMDPDASHQEIADHFKINPARVSEALHGKRA